MAKGGYRAGSGRPPGIKETRPRRRKRPSVASDQAKIRELLENGLKAKANIYKNMLRRVGNNETLTLSEQKLFLSVHEELSREVNAEGPPLITAVPDAETLEPLAYMLKVMNDPQAERERRDRMAISAAPFCHPRRGEAGTGKKEAQAERAKIAGSGKYASMSSPFRVVKP